MTHSTPGCNTRTHTHRPSEVGEPRIFTFVMDSVLDHIFTTDLTCFKVLILKTSFII